MSSVALWRAGLRPDQCSTKNMDLKHSAAMLATKRSVGVALELYLRIVQAIKYARRNLPWM